MTAMEYASKKVNPERQSRFVGYDLDFHNVRPWVDVSKSSSRYRERKGEWLLGRQENQIWKATSSTGWTGSNV